MLFPSLPGVVGAHSDSSAPFGPRGFGPNLNYEDPARAWYLGTDMTPSIPEQSQSGSSSGTPNLASSRPWRGQRFSTGDQSTGSPGGSGDLPARGSGGFKAGGSSDFQAGTSGGFGGFQAGPLEVGQELSLLGSNLLSVRQMPLAKAWRTSHVPLGTVKKRPLYPASHTAHFSSGYQRARDSRSHAKYSEDIFDHIPASETYLSESKGQPLWKE
ncbi:uncharacterized protein ACNS7B_001309 isoform 2-T2 [Menidia menidia]